MIGGRVLVFLVLFERERKYTVYVCTCFFFYTCQFIRAISSLRLQLVLYINFVHPSITVVTRSLELHNIYWLL